MGASVLLLTNAAGSLCRDLGPGEIMAIDDHINAMGDNPLRGPHMPVWGARFPDQSQVYDPRLRDLLDAAAAEIGERISHGVYAAVSGPAYETPAEVRALRALGADAVGMSTVPEAILAHAAGMRVAGLSCLTNWAAGIAGGELRHDDVITATRQNLERIGRLLAAFIRRVTEDER
jgi:purine-nucleoside phosphorylase